MSEIYITPRRSVRVKYDSVHELPDKVIGLYRDALHSVKTALGAAGLDAAVLSASRNDMPQDSQQTLQQIAGQLARKYIYGAFLRNNGSFTAILPVRENDIDLDGLLMEPKSGTNYDVFDDHVLSVLRAFFSAGIDYRPSITPYGRLLSFTTTHATSVSKDDFAKLIGEMQPGYFSDINLKFRLMDYDEMHGMGVKNRRHSTDIHESRLRITRHGTTYELTYQNLAEMGIPKSDVERLRDKGYLWEGVHFTREKRPRGREILVFTMEAAERIREFRDKV